MDFASGKLTDTSDPQDVITTGNPREASVHPELLLDKDEEEDYEFIRGTCCSRAILRVISLSSHDSY